MAKTDLTAARLRELLHYDPETGIFTRKVRTAQRHQVGDRADFVVKSGGVKGYHRVTVDSARYLAHRLAWFYVHGEWPLNHIDHLDSDRGNNRIKNLRDATEQLNRENLRRPRRDNSSGYLGVYFHQKRWYARVQLHGKLVHQSGHDTPEEAYSAYVAAKRKHHEGCTL